MSNVGAALYLNRKRKLKNFHPQGHVAPTKIIESGVVTNEDFVLDADALFDVELRLDADAEGTLFTLGDTTGGVTLAINADQRLDAQVGDLGVPPLTNGASAADIVLPLGVNFRLSWALNISEAGAQELIIWVDGRIVSRTAVEGTVTDWADSGDGSFLDAADTGINLLSELKYYARRVTE